MSLIEKAMGKRLDAIPDPNINKLEETVAHIESNYEEECPGGREKWLRKFGLSPEDVDVNCIEREYRRIKRPLIDNAIGRESALVEGGRSMVVTSAQQGEGKTFTAMNLGLSMAMESDLSVLLIDCDGTKSDLTKVFEAQDRPGLIDVLLERKKPSDVIMDTGVRQLKFIPSGGWHFNSTEMYASERMRWLISWLQETDSRRLVILDSPPLLPTTEAQVLAKLVGQVICVVRADVTTRRTVRGAIEMIDPSKAIGLILNGRRHKGNDDGGYGYYKYGDNVH